MLRRLLPVAVLLGCSGILGTGTASATALPIQDCTTTSGVIVAVDFSHWGGPVVRGCGSTPTTGYQLVNQGGFATTGTAHDGPGFICRISYSGFNGGTGEPADQKCLTTPPASASWSYWNANPGQSSWTLSPTGAANTNPPGGAVQAWTFGGGSPNFSPTSVRAQNSSPASSARSSSASRRGGTSAPVSQPVSKPTAPGSSTKGAAGNSSAAGKTSQSAGRSTGRAGSPASTPAASATGAVGILTLGSAGPTASQRIVDAEPDPAPHSSGSGSYVPELAGGAIVLGLAGLAGFTMWQRKRAG